MVRRKSNICIQNLGVGSADTPSEAVSVVDTPPEAANVADIPTENIRKYIKIHIKNNLSDDLIC